ncbi:hypothetical protein AX17_007016 [Amanita inopinata Kibby_2008]|nr:hypothetical protein AX17_007016 [Amanita inopinata Kibby_2008]
MTVTRPPPLQLKYDNFRLVVQSPCIIKRKKPFFNRIYQCNWRKAVITVATLNVIRFVLSAANAYQDAIVDRVQLHFQPAKMSFVICWLYALVAMIEVFGIISAFTRRLTWIRVYFYLSFLSALLVTAAGLVAAIIFFVFSDEILEECIALATQGKLYLKSTFRGEPWPVKRLSVKKAHKLCVVAWTNESSFQAASIFLCSFLPSILCLFLVYTYYRQVTDPNHQACLVTHLPQTATVLEHTSTRVHGRSSAVPVGQNQGRSQNGVARMRPQRQTEARMKTKPESFTTSQRRRLAPQGGGEGESSRRAAVGAGTSMRESRPLQLSTIMQSATSPYRVTPGPPSYAAAKDDRGYSMYYGPRLDMDSAGFDVS